MEFQVQNAKTKNPKPAAKTIDTAMIRRPDAIPPSLNAI